MPHGTPRRSGSGARPAARTAPLGSTRRSTERAACPGHSPPPRHHRAAVQRETRWCPTPPPSPARTTPHDPPAATPACPAATGTVDHGPPGDTTWPHHMIPNQNQPALPDTHSATGSVGQERDELGPGPLPHRDHRGVPIAPDLG